jgi:hypothetical protein
LIPQTSGTLLKTGPKCDVTVIFNKQSLSIIRMLWYFDKISNAVTLHLIITLSGKLTSSYKVHYRIDAAKAFRFVNILIETLLNMTGLL